MSNKNVIQPRIRNGSYVSRHSITASQGLAEISAGVQTNSQVVTPTMLDSSQQFCHRQMSQFERNTRTNSISSSTSDSSFESSSSYSAHSKGATDNQTSHGTTTFSKRDFQGKSQEKILIQSPPHTPSSVTFIATIQNARATCKALTKAKKENDSMIYLDGPQVYTCSNCRTHLTSHDDIISKSFHGRHGRAYLFDECVNVVTGPEEKRRLMTGLHVVCDIHCKRCKHVVGWTYLRAYERSQKYKEGKYVIEKINLHLEESPTYSVAHPAGERDDRWRKRSMSWGSAENQNENHKDYLHHDMVYEYMRNGGRSASLNSCSTCTEGTPASNSLSPFIRPMVPTLLDAKKEVPKLPFPELNTDTNS